MRARVEDVVDFFAKCPRCGYHATATRTVRELDSGRIETEMRATCGLPCGWEQTVGAVPPPHRSPDTDRGHWW
ncbi:hypothetical protein [Nocardia bovistercoris]|uniref:Uncharacterized protein n=1 Tax=Nocardia bovistercoris TaxID=2785916 RepID=A0A931N5G2_9NOCA|nr:hypothetical protein [Nocardia bovistercoris]MBH0779809.1 hypothetical protein [Nocardia bovistercoris]